ncbi:hypothetical protein [Roseomonas chloroacetimidivorans]|uniref:hypothetical protein n=1 Tax=Roseomonas chloroacetimidivorans TaxID=1766656 RepID=UPI003C791A21
MTHPPRLTPEQERDATILLIQAEEMITRWAKLEPEKRRFVLALVRAMSAGEWG